MSKDEIDSKKFKKWLDRQIKEAKLTPSEIADFNKWLMTRSGSDDEGVERKNRENGDISAKDVVEFVSCRCCARLLSEDRTPDDEN